MSGRGVELVGLRKSVGAAACAVAAAVLLGAPAEAAPVVFEPGVPLLASCDGQHPDNGPVGFEWTLVPLPGSGPFSPYVVAETGMRLVPSEFRILVGPLPAGKRRHDAQSGSWVKPGGGVPAPTECWVTGRYVEDGVAKDLTAIIKGKLV